MASGKAFAAFQSAILFVKVWTSGCLMNFIVRLQLFSLTQQWLERWKVLTCALRCPSMWMEALMVGKISILVSVQSLTVSLNPHSKTGTANILQRGGLSKKC